MGHEYNEKMFDVHTTSILRNVLVHSSQFLDQAQQPLFVQNFTQMQKNDKIKFKKKNLLHTINYSLFFGEKMYKILKIRKC
jgi:hypothetical protein